MEALPHAIVFDMDGTLTDSEEEWDVVRRGLAEADGVPWPGEATQAMMGMSTPEWTAYLVEAVGLRGTAHEAGRRTIDGMADAYRSGRIPVLPGAVDAVRRMAAIAPLAVASSSPPELIEAGLDLLGVRDLVGVVVSTEEVERGKPHPDGFLEAASRLGVDPTTCVAIEDSTNGVKSALAAGMRTVVVPPRFHPPAAEVLDRAHAVIDDLDALTVELVHGLF
ncbi:MAG TPA: HAD family phosphatase [Propionibacterium sp.]|nr:HAD family phosphatase [Propionibacterium sp.]